MVPWLNFDDILERRRSYDPVRFRNEAMGLPTVLGDHVVTLQELQECCADRDLARTFEMIPRNVHVPLIAGVDWGGGVHSRTVLVIGRMRRDYIFEVLSFEAFHAPRTQTASSRKLQIVATHFRSPELPLMEGAMVMYTIESCPKQLQPRLGFCAILYSTVDQAPLSDGILTKWVVGRSPTIGVLFTHIKQKRISFPRQQEVGQFLDEFACEVALYDDANRRDQVLAPRNATRQRAARDELRPAARHSDS